MRVAIIEYGHREYLMETFVRHPEFDAQIACFAEYHPEAESFRGIQIIPLEELEKTGYDFVLVAVGANDKLARLLVWLHDHNISNVYILRLFALQMHTDFIAGTRLNMSCVDKMPENEEKPYLVHLETHVCDHCNLNCKACNNFSPFVRERQVTDITQYEKDMQNLSGLFSGIGRFFLLGGEPLLEPELCCDMIRISRQYFPRAELRILTNATLLLKMRPAFWECLRVHQVILHITAYPPIRDTLPDIIDKVSTESVKYIVDKAADKFVKRLTHYAYEDAEYNNEYCGSTGCHYLRDGYISKCPDAVLIGNMAQAIGCAPEKLQSKQTIRLSDVKDPWQIIRELNRPIDMCKRCSCQRLTWFPWEVSGNAPEPEDWFIESRLEYENRELKEQIDSLSAERDQLKNELDRISESTNEERCRIKDELDKITASVNEEQTRYKSEFADLNGKLEEQKCMLDKQILLVDAAKKEAFDLKQKLVQANSQLEDSREQLIQLQNVCSTHIREKSELDLRITNLYQSRSWRITRPLRVIDTAFRKIFGKG